MKLKNIFAPEVILKSTYQIKMSTSFGDGDGIQDYDFLVTKENIHSVILEIISLDRLFSDGRNTGDDPSDDPAAYLLDENGNSDKFSWLTNFPYNSDYEQKNSLQSYEIYYFDDTSGRYRVEALEVKNFTEEIKAYNEKQQIGDHHTWYGRNKDDTQFQDYRVGLYAIIDKFLLEMNLEKSAEKNDSLAVKFKV